MRFALAGLAMIMNALDNLTTFSCLSRPVEGYEVYEANKIAAWGFETFGLVPGLIFEMVLTTAAIAFLVYSRSFSLPLRLSILGAMVVLPAWAAINNAMVMQALGIQLVLS
jgi:hypothetical protein